MFDKDLSWKDFALGFATILTQRDYYKAYAMTSKEYQKQKSIDEMISDFEYSCPSDYGAFGPICVDQTLEDWPDKKKTDIGWVYVTIGGEFMEAITVIVTIENNGMKIRRIEVGRP